MTLSDIREVSRPRLFLSARGGWRTTQTNPFPILNESRIEHVSYTSTSVTRETSITVRVINRDVFDRFILSKSAEVQQKRKRKKIGISMYSILFNYMFIYFKGIFQIFLLLSTVLFTYIVCLYVRTKEGRECFI